MERADYLRAVSLYRGPLLDGFFLSGAPEFERWAEGKRERLARAHAKSLEELALAAEGAKDFVKAAEWWKARAAQDPYDSRVALELMRALVASGNRAGALQHASIHQRLLQEEFGVVSAPELATFVERLRAEPVSGTPPLSERPEVGPRPSPASYSSPAASAAPKNRPRRMGVIAALVIVAFSVGAVWSAVRPGHRKPERSIVVLPFIDMSPAHDNEYFSDGLTEEVIARLSRIPGLKVISRTSAMHYKGSERPVRQIADELNVAHVLEGSVRQSEGRVRITAQLVDARADEHLWAENYDHTLDDIFRVQEEIAHDVANALEVELGGRGNELPVKRGTRDPEAYELYRRGRYLWNTRTKEGHERAVEYYRQAIGRDSRFADAYAGLADAYLTAYQFNLSRIPEAETYSRLKWAAERALALDEASADAHTSFAVVLWWQRNWPGAERELRRALELDPGHSTARIWYSLLLAGMGRTEEALEQSRRAYELDPFAIMVSIHYAWQYYVNRDYDAAIEQYRRTLEINASWAPAYAQLGLTYAQKGMPDEAIRAARKGVELVPRSDYLATLADVLARAGKRAEALEALQRAKKDVFEEYHIARAYVGLREPDSAFAWLERSSWQWPHRAVRSDPALDPLRSDPRFAHLVSRVDQEMGLR